MLPGSTLERIKNALDISPCGRCGQDHKLKNCPVNEGKKNIKGAVWSTIGPAVIKEADDYLKAHAEYSYAAPPPVKKAPTARKAQGAQPTANRNTFQAPGNSAFGGGRGSTATHSAASTSSRTPPATTSGLSTVRPPTYSATSSMYYPPAIAKLPDNFLKSSNTGKAWTLPSTMQKRTETLKTVDPKFPLRVNFFARKDQLKVLTNHFEYKVVPGTDFYEYKILDLGTKNRKKLKALINNAIANWPFLSVNTASFATNYVDTIVSWMNLHSSLDTDKGAVGHGNFEWGRTIVDGTNNLAVRFRYVKTISTHNLVQYATGDPNYEHANFDDIATCLNLVISKSFGNNVHKLSANKFFVKSARARLSTSKSLEIIRGYFYNVKPGMGNIILNFNISTSAVFRPILIADFLHNRDTTFTPEQRPNVLKGKNVYIEPDRKDVDAKKQRHLNMEESRYWKICEIQSTGNIEDLTFQKKMRDANGNLMLNPNGTYMMEPGSVRVVDHLQQGKKGTKLSVCGSDICSFWYCRSPTSSCSECGLRTVSYLVCPGASSNRTVSAIYSSRTRCVHEVYGRRGLPFARREPSVHRERGLAGYRL